MVKREKKMEIDIIYWQNRIFVGHYNNETRMLNDAVEIIPIPNLISGYVIGSIYIDKYRSLFGKLQKDSPYYQVYFQIVSNIKLVNKTC